MGIWSRRDSSRQEPSSPITIDRKIVRFRRLVEQHSRVLDMFVDLEDKQSGDYILDSQYIEAGLDRVYEGVSRILYDMHVITDSGSAEGYDRLDRLRNRSERILKDAHERAAEQDDSSLYEAPDWETLALQALFQDLTRLPAYGTGSGMEASLAAPESLTEWAAWAHVRTAQWLTEKLPLLSPSPDLYLLDEETETFCVRVFLLSGVKEAETALKERLACEPSVYAEAPSLLPLLYFLEGLRFPSGGTRARPLHVADRVNQEAGQPAAQLELYVGEDFLLLRLPSWLPVRLLWCCLSVEQSENLIYLYGIPHPSLFEELRPEPFASEKAPFPAHQCGIAGRWMHWASGFSWAQGEERIRVLGHSLAGDRKVREDPVNPEDVRKCLQEGMTVFLEQTVLPQKEVNPWKSL